MQTDFGWMLVRLCYAGPLLYIGLAMALDPAGFAAGLNHVTRALRDFEQHLREPRWDVPVRELDSIPLSRNLRIAISLAGTVLAIGAVLHLAGLVT